jgi:hypothetical protein
MPRSANRGIMAAAAAVPGNTVGPAAGRCRRDARGRLRRLAAAMEA